MSTVTDELVTIIRTEGVRMAQEMYTGLSKAISDSAAAEAKANAERERAARTFSLTISKMQEQIGLHQRYAAGAAVVSGAIIGIGAASIKAATEVEQAQRAFATLLRSPAQGQDMVKDLREFARQTPFTFRGALPLAQRSLAYGFKKDDVIPFLKDIGNATAAIGGTEETMGRLILAFGQIKSAGRLLGTELRQITDTGIPAVDILKDAGVITTGDVGQIGKAGIPAKEAIDALLKGFQRLYGGAMAGMMETATGKTSNLSDAVNDLKIAIGEGLLPEFKSAVTLLTAFTGGLAGMGDTTKSVVADLLTVGGVGAIVVGATQAFQAFAMQQEVNRMQAAALNAELERQGIILAGNGRLTLAAGAAKFAGAGIVAGAVGYAAGGYLENAGTGAGMAGTAGTVLAGAGVGLLLSGGNPIGAIVGALSALGGAAYRATKGLDALVAGSNKQADAMASQYPMTFLPEDMPGASRVKGARQGYTVTSEGQGIRTGFSVETADLYAMTATEAQGRGLIGSDEELGKDVKWWEVFTTKAAMREQAWRSVLANSIQIIPPPSTDATPGEKNSEAARAEVDDLAQAQADAAGEADRWRQALVASNAPMADVIGASGELRGALQAEVDARQARLTVLNDELTAMGSTGTVSERMNKTTERNAEAAALWASQQRIANLEMEDGAVQAARMASAYENIGKALADAQSGAMGYAGLLRELGGQTSDPLMQKALQYQRLVGNAQAYVGIQSGNYQQYLGGLGVTLAAEKELRGPGAAGSRTGFSFGAGDVMAPWQWSAASGNAREQIRSDVQVWVETPQGWLRANTKSVQATMARDNYFGGQ